MTAIETTLSSPAIAAKPAARKPSLTIRAKPSWGIFSGWVAPMNFRELWRFRDLLFSLVSRDIKLRYKQTALGVAWVILQPLVAAGIFSLVFGKLANLPADHTATGQPIPLFLFTFTGLVAWNLFFGIINRLSGILVGNSALVSKVYFPRILLPLSGALGVLVDLAVVLVLMIVLQAIAGIPVTAQVLLAPVMLALIAALALGIGMWAAALCVEYRDVGYVLPVVLQFLLFGSPVLYSDRVAEKFGDLAFLFYLNPLAGLLGTWKWAVLSTPLPPAWAVTYAVIFSLGMLALGTLIFRRMERTFSDVI